MTLTDDRETQPISMPELLSTTATIAMRPPRRRLRVTPLRLVVVAGVVLIAAAFVWSATDPGAVPVPSSAPVPSASLAPHGGTLSFPTDGATLPAERSHAAVVVDAAPSFPQPPVSAPVAVVVAPSPSPSPSGSASGSPSPSPSPSPDTSGSSSSASPGASPSTPDTETS